MGGSRVVHHGRIQSGSLFGDPGSVSMGGSRMGNYGVIQGGSLWGNPRWLIRG